MRTFLLSLGGFLAALAVLCLLVYLWLRAKFRGILRSFGDALGELAKCYAPKPPMRLMLERAEALEWDNPAAVEAVCRPLEEAGFVAAGEFTASANVLLRLRGLAHPGKSIFAVIYEAQGAGIWFDLVTQYGDGTSLTYTTAPTTALATAPGKRTERLPGQDAATVLAKFLADRPAGEKRPTPPEQFAARLEQAYADSMDFMAERGGPTAEEIRAVGAADGNEVDDTMVSQIQDSWRRHFNEFWAEKLRERFLAVGGVSAAAWEKIRDRVVLVHDRLSPPEVVALLQGCVDADDDEHDDEHDDDERDGREEDPMAALRAIAVEHPAREAFAKMNDTLPPQRRFQKRGEVDLPRAADVWIAPDVVE